MICSHENRAMVICPESQKELGIGRASKAFENAVFCVQYARSEEELPDHMLGWAFHACYGIPLSEEELDKLDPATVRRGLKELTAKETLSMNDLMESIGLFAVIAKDTLSPEALELGAKQVPIPHNFEYFPAPKEKKPRKRDKRADRRHKRDDHGYQVKKATKRAKKRASR